LQSVYFAHIMFSYEGTHAIQFLYIEPKIWAILLLGCLHSAQF